jgi:hypothetical protein
MDLLQQTGPCTRELHVNLSEVPEHSFPLQLVVAQWVIAGKRKNRTSVSARIKESNFDLALVIGDDKQEPNFKYMGEFLHKYVDIYSQTLKKEDQLLPKTRIRMRIRIWFSCIARG